LLLVNFLFAVLRCALDQLAGACPDVSRNAAAVGVGPSRGDKCLGFFVVGTADAEQVPPGRYRPKPQPLADKVVWKLSYVPCRSGLQVVWCT
jgi:hypothetical protein